MLQVRYECYYSRTGDDNTGHWWFGGNSTEPQRYFPGGSNVTGGCPCSLNESCIAGDYWHF